MVSCAALAAAAAAAAVWRWRASTGSDLLLEGAGSRGVCAACALSLLPRRLQGCQCAALYLDNLTVLCCCMTLFPLFT